MIAIQFPSLLNLVEYQLTTHTQRYVTNTIDKTISGLFTEAAIELAIAGYGAEVVAGNEATNLNKEKIIALIIKDLTSYS